HLAEHVGIELLAEGGGDVEQLAVVVADARERRLQEVAHRAGDVDLDARARERPPAVAAPREHSVVLQRAQHLEEEERVALRLLEEAEAELLDEALAVEHGPEQRGDIARTEAAELDVRDVR